MKNRIVIIIIILCVLLFACSKKVSSTTNYESYSDTQLQTEGWKNFTQGNYNNAITYFEILSRRATSSFKGYNGLGWCYLMQYQFSNAESNYKTIIALDTLNTVVATDTLYSDLYAGLSLVYASKGESALALEQTSKVQVSWTLKAKPVINYKDIVLIRATSFYDIGQFENSLVEVKKIEPAFSCDVSTSEGRLLLARKIEELSLTLRDE